LSEKRSGKLSEKRSVREVLRLAAALNLNWHVNKHGHIRDKEHHSCPITAVCESITGRRYLPKYWEFAAADIGLPHREGAELADACDKTHRYNHALRSIVKDILIHKTL
jgi:hypothetical protein